MISSIQKIQEDLERLEREYKYYSSFEYEFYQWEETQLRIDIRDMKIDFLLGQENITD